MSICMSILYVHIYLCVYVCIVYVRVCVFVCMCAHVCTVLVDVSLNHQAQYVFLITEKLYILKIKFSLLLQFLIFIIKTPHLSALLSLCCGYGSSREILLPSYDWEIMVVRIPLKSQSLSVFTPDTEETNIYITRLIELYHRILGHPVRWLLFHSSILFHPILSCC